MMKWNMIVSAAFAVLALSACNQGGGNSDSVNTPNSYPYYYQGPGQNSPCLNRQNFQNRNDMCGQLRDGRAGMCDVQARYNLFQNACGNMNWQERGENERGVPGLR